MEDYHVDRLGVEVRQRMKLTSTNNSNELYLTSQTFFIHNYTCCPFMVWWLLRGENTRFHSELGRENPQRRWYFILRCGRVGRCQALKVQKVLTRGGAVW